MEVGELFDEMLEECTEALHEVEDALMALDHQHTTGEPLSSGTVDLAFRGMHTLKGMLAFLEAEPMKILAHAAETVLSGLRADGAVLRREDLSHLDESIELLSASLQSGLRGPSMADIEQRSATLATTLQESPAAQLAPVVKVKRKKPRLAVPPPPGGVAAVPPPPKTSESQAIRVRVDKLDELVNLVGELVLAENSLIHELEEQGVRAASLEGLNRVSRSLQDLAMTVRLVPVRSAFRKFGRMASDLARRQGKLLDLQLVGEETEVDKTVIEAISDPLLHLIRNACDHGIEPPEERLHVGKPEVGVLRLSAHHEGDEVHITIQDDGRGLDTAQILQQAQNIGLTSPDAPLTPHEIERLVFAPGLSTATEVSELSGRGVGMDVVASKVAAVGGSIEIDTQPGAGTRWTIQLPLTLAIIDGMLFRRGTHILAVSLDSISELLPGTEIDTVARSSVELHGQTVPVLGLQDVLGPRSDSELLLVIRHGERLAIVPVDALIGQQQLVVKPMPTLLQAHRGWSGCTILSSGEIGLVLDAKRLLQRCRPHRTPPEPIHAVH